ncbi:methionyl-tRNA formyltransferase [Cypionkella sp.]|uniref:methionyl-tRNA formyltransferase n=1 Tax=Cypionkella sp. TaxID=2811411 RepID=UPI002725B758|nr:methionyl-tRNA formyltransferase [Cypionkella sp.]MDO8985287.1 methionyl-tRNA formyltransferase [Cypionkella sp.]MDP2051773.1 methionyl-tRNA formyltransferase [Cypionkella sp.]
MKIIFMGTPEFSVPILKALSQHHEIIAVYCQPPRPAGRGKADRASPVQHCAEALGLPVFHPVSLRTVEAQHAFAALEADLAVVVAYGLILPQAVLDQPRLGCLNIHASLLPRWRGAAPIHRAIMAGDTETGISIMQMEAGLDTGPVLAREATAIGAEETTADLQDRLSMLGAKLITATIDLLPLEAIPQSEQGVTYASKIDKAEARVDWSKPAALVDRQIRGLSPFPGAWCEVNGERIKLLRSRATTGSGAVGQVLNGLRIACGDGAVEITLAQREGKRPMSAADILNGLKMPETLT